MFRRILCAGAALAAFLAMPSVSEAQVRYNVGVRSGGVGISVGNTPYYRGYGYPGYGYPGYGYPGYGRSGVTIGVGVGGYSGYGYPGYGYPGYYNRYYTPYVPVTGYVPYYGGSSATYIVQPPPVTYSTMPPATDPPQADNTAVVELVVPANAKVLFDGKETQQGGTNRRYVSPELVPGYDYTYTIRASWTENGEAKNVERKVVVQAGQHYRVDMTGEALSTPKKEP